MADIIYLKDGQIINGVVIKKTKKTLRVKGKYKTYTLKRSKIESILKGGRKLEKVYIQLKDNRLVDGYMVDQDNVKVVYRPVRDKPKEVTILKSNIQQMSNEKILMLIPEISFRSGILMPLTTKDGSNLDFGILYMGGFGLRFPFIKKSRVQFEAGYVKNTSTFSDYADVEREVVLYTIPILINYQYTHNLYEMFSGIKGSRPGSGGLWDSFLMRTYLFGKLGAGISYLNFYNGEGKRFQGIFGSVLTSVGFSFEIVKRILYVQLANDFLFIIDENAVLIPYIFTLSLNYRY
ncbi:hypothetical protein ACFL20_03745 [Spirochaetota bacterium]